MFDYIRRIVGYTFTDYKINAKISKELKITPLLDILLEYKRNWIQHVNSTPRNRLHRVMKHYFPTGRRIMVDLWRNFWIRETGTCQQVSQTPWEIYDNAFRPHLRNIWAVHSELLVCCWFSSCYLTVLIFHKVQKVTMR